MSLFDIFGDHITRRVVKNVSRQPLNNIENMGKSVTTGPIKPNEPVKKGDTKKSFLSNTGKALQSTPTRQVFTPRMINVGSMIYTDEDVDKGQLEEIEFTKPKHYDNHQRDLFDFIPLSEPAILKQFSPPSTPPPVIRQHSLELDCSYQDEFYTDDFSNESLPEEDLGLPALY